MIVLDGVACSLIFSFESDCLYSVYSGPSSCLQTLVGLVDVSAQKVSDRLSQETVH